MSGSVRRGLRFLLAAAVLMVSGALLFNVSAVSKPTAPKPGVSAADQQLFRSRT